VRNPLATVGAARPFVGLSASPARPSGAITSRANGYVERASSARSAEGSGSRFFSIQPVHVYL
jgi:hypothetical protein